jgi:hypothetical protein
MSDILRICRASMRSLISGYGCLDAVASMVSARFDVPASKGTLSKKMAGHNEFSLAEIIALEDATGRYPVTEALWRRLDAKPERIAGCLLTLSANVAKEGGEAVSALLTAMHASNPDDLAQAIKEVDDLMHVLRETRASLENQQVAQVK